MTDKHEPFLAFPPQSHWRHCSVVALFLTGLFIFVFSGCDYLTQIRVTRYRIDFAFEQSIPFVPELSVVYSSLYLTFAAMPFVLRTKTEVNQYVWLMGGVTLAAGVGFLILPAELQFDVPSDLGRVPWVFQWADRLNLTHNLCPSLHVGYIVMNAEVFRRRSRWAGVAGHVWAIAIALSAWLTYQHHLVDLIGGYLLAIIATRFSSATHRPTS